MLELFLYTHFPTLMKQSIFNSYVFRVRMGTVIFLGFPGQIAVFFHKKYISCSDTSN